MDVLRDQQMGTLALVANTTADGTTISSFAYDLDAVGNRLGCLEASGIRTSWTYDDANQLTNELRTGANSYNVTHVYDEVGNRTVQIDDGTRTTFTFNAANQITKQEVGSVVATLTYQPVDAFAQGLPDPSILGSRSDVHPRYPGVWDGECKVSTGSSGLYGNARTAEVPGDPIITLTWDYEDRLIEKAQTPVKTANDYDPDGLRVRRRQFLGAVVVATDKHVWDAMNILLETDSSDVTQRIYTLEPEVFGNLISKRASGSTEYYHFDGLGSTRNTTDGSQAIARSYAFRAFGEYVIGSWDTNQPFTWVGRVGYYDDFDRFYIRARHYSAGIAVWLSEDPIPDDLGTLYQYVGNRPTWQKDPSGLRRIRCNCELAIEGERFRWKVTIECRRGNFAKRCCRDACGTACSWEDAPDEPLDQECIEWTPFWKLAGFRNAANCANVLAFDRLNPTNGQPADWVTPILIGIGLIGGPIARPIGLGAGILYASILAYCASRRCTKYAPVYRGDKAPGPGNPDAVEMTG